ATRMTVTTDEDTPVSIPLAGTDVEGSALSFAIVTNPVSGVLSGTPPNVTYTPNTNFNGTDSFSFKVNDGLADSGPAMVSITVNPVNDAPWVDAGTNQVVDQIAFQSANLLVNGGNEAALVNGDIPGSTEVIGPNWTKGATNTGQPPAVQGTNCFYPGAVASAELRQDVNCSNYSATIDSGIQIFQF